MARTEKPRITKGLVDSLTPDPERDRVVWDGELPGFGVRVKPSGRKTYVLQYRNAEGRSRRLTLGAHGVLTPAAARQAARQHLADVTLGEDPAEERQQQRQGLSFRELAERYLEDHLIPKRKPSTVQHFRQILRAVVLPKLGHRKAASLCRRDVEHVHRSQVRTPSQGNRAVSIISAILGFGERRDLLPPGSNPCSLIERYPETRRERFLSPAELGRVGAALDQMEAEGRFHPSAILAIRLLALTGMRSGEVLTLRWSAVDFDRSCVHLEDSKTGRKRVPLASPALELLDRATRCEGNPYVCWGAKEGSHYYRLQEPWERVRELTGLYEVRLHDLRHTFASFGALEGIGLYLIGKVLGHRQTSTTERYAHIGPDPVGLAASAIGQRVAAHLSNRGKGGDD